jgi:UPF0755 protein
LQLSVKEILNKLAEILQKVLSAISRFVKEKGIDEKLKNFLRWLIEQINLFFEILVVLFRFYKENFRNFYPKRAKYRLLLISVTVLYVLWIVTFNILYSRYYWESGTEKKFLIRQGKTLSEISQELRDSGIISNQTSFTIAAKYLGAEDRIIAGFYNFTEGMNNIDIVNQITSPDYTLRSKGKFRVPEGLRLKQIAKLAEKELQLSADLFLKEASNDTLISILGLNGVINNLEGFIFPDTYILPVSIDERGLVKIMFEEFYKKILKNTEINKYFSGNGKKLLELVTLASIVQGEAGVLSEMPRIAGVYLNRIETNMKLQADPTIQYIIPDEKPRRLTTSDLRIESPYNTYLNKGLPPGPINCPGLDAIKSIIYPEKHNYYFFVARGDKTHVFSESFEEHKKAINDIRSGK